MCLIKRDKRRDAYVMLYMGKNVRTYFNLNKVKVKRVCLTAVPKVLEQSMAV